MKRYRILFGVILLIGLVAVSRWEMAEASTNGHSQSDAVNWARSKEGTAVDYYADKSIECMDLVAGCYYNYLGHPISGLGCPNNIINNTDHAGSRASTDLGWEMYGNSTRPEPGDIVLWKNSGTGHIGIILSVSSDYFTYIDYNHSRAHESGKIWDSEGLYDFTKIIRPDFRKIPRKNVLSGVYVIHSAHDDDYVLDIKGNSKENDANIQLYHKENNSDVQKFRIIRWDNDYYCIQSVYSGKWLDVARPIEDRANVKLYYDNEADEDFWYFEDAGNGYVYIKNKTGFYLDLENNTAENNSNICIYSFVEKLGDEDNKSQKWRLEDVTDYYDLEEGLYTVSTARNDDYQLDIYGNQTGNRANIQLYEKENSTVQLFQFIRKGSYYVIKSVYADKWLDIQYRDDGIIGNNSTVQLWESNNAAEQHWVLEDAGNGYVYMRSNADYYLDVEGDRAENNADVQVYHFADNNSQRWRLNKGEHTVSYHENGGNGAPPEQTKVYGINLTLSATIPTCQDRYFAGWNTSADGAGVAYQPGATFRTNEDTTLYAIWVAPDFFLPGDLQSVEEAAFEGDSFTFAWIPGGVSSIGDRAFAACGRLKHIYIPESVTRIADDAFEDVTELTIHGAQGSYAETYAAGKGFDFIAG